MYSTVIAKLLLQNGQCVIKPSLPAPAVNHQRIQEWIHVSVTGQSHRLDSSKSLDNYTKAWVLLYAHIACVNHSNIDMAHSSL